MRVCPICGRKFSVANIRNTSKAKGKNRIYCFSCVPYKTDQILSKSQYVRRAIKHQLVLYKGGKCERCGYDKSEAALQFHHLSSKIFTLSGLIPTKNTDMRLLYAEVDKCALLCANCHAEEHEL